MFNLMKLFTNPDFGRAIQNISIENNEIVIHADLTLRVRGKIKIISDDDIIVLGERIHLNPSFDENNEPITHEQEYDYYVVDEHKSDKYRRRKCNYCQNHKCGDHQ